MKIFTILLFSLFILTHPTFSQDKEIKRLNGSKIKTTEIGRIVTKLMDTANVQGLSIGILNDNKIEFIKSYGYKNKKENELLDTSTVLYAASFSKPVFAFLTLKLVQENILDLDKPLYKYLDKPIPEYDDYSCKLPQKQYVLKVDRIINFKKRKG